MFSLTKQDTSVLKGIAIIAMLFHHLYACPPEGFAPYTGVLAWIGVLGKVCVAMFLFCSGYGLASQYKPMSIKEDIKFILRRLTKFYLNYWVVFFIFVPVSYFVFGRTLTDAYGEHVNIVKRFIYDIFGVQNPAYNITWWFNKLIIILYMLFPLLFRAVRLKPWLAALFGMALMRYSAHIHIPYDNIYLCIWQFPFVLGVVWKCYEAQGIRLQEWLTNRQSIAIPLSLALLAVMVILRMYPVIPHWSGIRMDGFLACATALCVITIVRRLPYTTEALAFFGKHSMNIYLTHTFLNGYWHPEWLHTCEWMRGGGNLLILAILCLAISIALEFMKQKIGLYKLADDRIIKRL